MTTWTTACQASLSITSFQSLLKLMSIKLIMPYNHLILCHPLLLPPSIFPSIRVFSSKFFSSGGQSIRVSASGSVLPMNIQDCSMDWFDILAVQGSLKSLLQHHSSKASILWCSAFFMVQLSQLCMTTGKTIALSKWNFVGILMSLLFNTLSRFIIAFLSSSKRLYFHNCSNSLQ